jgi:SAM-dependent methyltransferase
MVYLAGIPDTEEIHSLYQQYGDYKQNSQFAPNQLSWWGLKVAAARDFHISILKNSGGLNGRSLVEIGCSFGRFLQLARDCGASVAGVELDQKAVAYLRQLGIEAHDGLITARQSDIICAFHLIEHLEAPHRFLTEVAALLNEDGRLLLAMPNAGDWETIGEGWVGFRLDLEHFNYFTVRTLSLVLNRCGLYIEKFWFHKQPAVSRSNSRQVKNRTLPEFYRKLVDRLAKSQQTLSDSERGTYTLTALARKTPRPMIYES